MRWTRRRAIAAGGTLIAAGAAAWTWPEQGFVNPCLGGLPGATAVRALLRDAYEGVDAARLLDAHVHVFGTGDGGDRDVAFDGGRGSLRWPIGALQRTVLANAACAPERAFDAGYVERLVALAEAMPPGARCLLLALDAWHDAAGRADPARTHLRVGNDFVARVAARAPGRFLWAASVHPARVDALAELERVRRLGAVAVKWIPSAQGIDPASPACDAYYQALARARLPLITHAGTQRAAPGDDALGNPLRLRRPLEHGVTVVVAHCASMGASPDLDRGAGGPAVPNFALFERLMDEPAHAGRLWGDLSALTQSARAGAPLARVLERGVEGGDWAGRLVNGSDYPLPAILPLTSPRALADDGWLDPALVEPLRALRGHDALSFDFALKRHLRIGGRRLAAAIFEGARLFATTGDSMSSPSMASR